MKPTHKQVVEWARHSGIDVHTWMGVPDLVLLPFAALAYEAGRKDENEAFEKEINKEDLESLDDEAYCILVALLAWLRARREQ